MSDPTARQIAEPYWRDVDCRHSDSHGLVCQICANQIIATLTADLAQARQEIAGAMAISRALLLRYGIEVDDTLEGRIKRLAHSLFEAQQAHAEAKALAWDYSEQAAKNLQARDAAQQTAEHERTTRVSTALMMAQQVAIAEQARDAALAVVGRYEATYRDALIAHKWFAQWFGVEYNGRDFAVKCEMANEPLQSAARTALLEAAEEAVGKGGVIWPAVALWLRSRAGGDK